VPDEYLEFANNYPVVLNGKVKDIRKSNYSTLTLLADSDHAGPVIVKSNFNYAGMPEHTLSETWWDGNAPLARKLRRARDRFSRRKVRLGDQETYQIYDHLADVPRESFVRHDLIVEKFLPEREDSLYVIRNMNFLGKNVYANKLRSRSPIVAISNIVDKVPIDVDPGMLELAHSMGFDYGKFDYVVHDGKPILIDANKTTGTGPSTNPEKEARRRYMAEGLYQYLA
jgi:hypothetical protein